MIADTMPRTVINSVQNPRIKQAIRLRDRRGRKRQNRMIVDGWREIGRAFESGICPLEFFYCESGLTPEQMATISRWLTPSGLTPTAVSETVFHKLAFGDRTEGAVLVAVQPERTLNAIQLPREPLVAVLESIEKPGNLGAILRSADAAGVSALIVADPLTDLFNPNTIRASLGSVFTLPLCSAPADQVVQWLRVNQLAVYAARVDGSVPYTSVDYCRPAAIVFGSESAGLSELWLGDWITPISLPMLGIVDSLNVSATAAVLFYEARRQRQ